MRFFSECVRSAMIGPPPSGMEPLFVKGLSQEVGVMRDQGEETFNNNIPAPHFSFRGVEEANLYLYALRAFWLGLKIKLINRLIGKKHTSI